MNQIIPISAFNDNYIWLITDISKKYAAIVDPGDPAPVLEKLKQLHLQLTAILITHHHADHCAGVSTLLEHYSVPVYGPSHEIIKDVSIPVNEKNRVNLEALNLQFKVLDIPGHTKGHIAFYTDFWVFCGDTLFCAGCGRVFEGTSAQMLQSLTKIANLPDATKVYCGHEYTQANLEFALKVEPENKEIHQRLIETVRLRERKEPSVPSTIGLEKRTNPFLRCHLETVRESAQQFSNQLLPTPTEVFTVIRSWKDHLRN